VGNGYGYGFVPVVGNGYGFGYVMKVTGMGIQRCYPWIVYPFHLYLCIIDSLKILFPCEKSGCYSLGHLCNSTSVTVAATVFYSPFGV
jgi:hypothetical protein